MWDSWGPVLAALIPLALVVALSPLSIIPAVVLVLHSPHPRRTGLAFLLGWLAGLAGVTAIFVGVPRLLDGFHIQLPPWTDWVRIVLGVVLIVLAVWLWVKRKRSTHQPKWLDRTKRITPTAAATIGIVLVLANPKVLAMNAAAGLVIGTGELGVPGVWLAVAYYTALDGSTAAAPVLAHAVAAERVDRQLEHARRWMENQQAAITAVLLVLVGAVLVYTGIQAA
ncbi:MAG TPA: GAP family protein [Mycobacterium sp.]